MMTHLIQIISYNPDITLLLLALSGYLLGSIPSGLLLAKAMGKGDLRQIGSGNIGATNALRTGDKTLAFLTLLADVTKGSAAVGLGMLIAYLIHIEPNVDELFSHKVIWLWTGGLAAIFGHIMPVWLKFKGGKGVATSLGVLLAAIPIIGGLAFITWLITAFVSRISSLAALLAALTAPLYTYFILIWDGALSGSDRLVILLVTIVALMIWLTHRANITRLLRGEESRIGQ